MIEENNEKPLQASGDQNGAVQDNGMEVRAGMAEEAAVHQYYLQSKQCERK